MSMGFSVVQPAVGVGGYGLFGSPGCNPGLLLFSPFGTLDRAVDKCYRGKKFESERERVEFLFGIKRS